MKKSLLKLELSPQQAEFSYWEDGSLIKKTSLDLNQTAEKGLVFVLDQVLGSEIPDTLEVNYGQLVDTTERLGLMLMRTLAFCWQKDLKENLN